MFTIKRILVPIDFSDVSHAAVSVALQLASDNEGCEIIGLYVQPDLDTELERRMETAPHGDAIMSTIEAHEGRIRAAFAQERDRATAAGKALRPSATGMPTSASKRATGSTSACSSSTTARSIWWWRAPTAARAGSRGCSSAATPSASCTRRPARSLWSSRPATPTCATERRAGGAPGPRGASRGAAQMSLYSSTIGPTFLRSMDTLRRFFLRRSR